MAISIFPSTAAEFVSNNFVVDMNDTTNNTADTGGVKQAGPYSMSFSSGDTSFDVYFVDSEGNSVGYSNTTSIVATGLFTTVVIFGVAQDEVISFQYQGSVNNADGEGDEPGAGAYLESISPTDLPSIDDTATVTGGNFGANTEITFESGTTVLAAKSITVSSSTELLVTRPDALIEDDAPYTVRAVTTGVPQPTGTNANLLVDEVTAGSDPTWVTTSPLNDAAPGVSFSQTLEATDAEGLVVDYSITAGTLTPGLSLDSSTGVLSGTPTTAGTYTFTVTATDDGENTTPKQFEQLVAFATGGTVTTDGTFTYHTFTSSNDLLVLTEIVDAELFILAGGGAGGSTDSPGNAGGGGGAGGLLEMTTTLSAGTITCTVGAGALNEDLDGSNSTMVGIGTAVGGGAGAKSNSSGSAGGSGGGGSNGSGGSGTAGQGNDGGTSTAANISAGGGGAGGLGQLQDGGVGVQRTAIATQSGINVDGGYFAGGGGGARDQNSTVFGEGGLGGGGNGGATGAAENGTANTGGGGGGESGFAGAGLGGSGLIVVRYSV